MAIYITGDRHYTRLRNLDAAVMTPERKQKLLSVLDRRQEDITVVLENVFDPHNVSAVMRTCDAVGIHEIFVVNTIAPPQQRWGYRSSSGAYKWLRVHQFTDVQACTGAVRNKYKSVLATRLSAGSVALYEIDFTQSLALVFGNEHHGVSDEMLALCDGSFIIPQAGMIVSLNISVACAVTLYEAYRQKNIAGHYRQRNLADDTYQELLTDWTDPKK